LPELSSLGIVLLTGNGHDQDIALWLNVDAGSFDLVQFFIDFEYPKRERRVASIREYRGKLQSIRSIVMNISITMFFALFFIVLWFTPCYLFLKYESEKKYSKGAWFLGIFLTSWLGFLIFAFLHRNAKSEKAFS